MPCCIRAGCPDFFEFFLFPASDCCSSDISLSRTLSTATLLGAVTRTFHRLQFTAHRINSATVVVLPMIQRRFVRS